VPTAHFQWSSLPVCVSIGSSKTLAKLANHVAKKFALFNSVCDFSTMSAARMHWLLSRIDVRAVWGVGRRTGDKLHAIGIQIIQALRDAPPPIGARQHSYNHAESNASTGQIIGRSTGAYGVLHPDPGLDDLRGRSVFTGLIVIGSHGVDL
jgi:hypothetical protein